MNGVSPGEFKVSETHGILFRSENRTHRTSKGLGWSSLYASSQFEQPYEDKFDAVDDHLIILHLSGPVAVTRVLGKIPARRTIAPGGLFILPGGHDFGVRLEGALETLHLYIRKRLVDEVAEEFGSAIGANVELMDCLGDQDLLIERLALEIQDALDEDDDTGLIYADYLAHALAARLIRKHSTGTRSCQSPIGAFTKMQFARTIDYMQARLDCSIRLDDLAAASGLSVGQYARRFKITTGYPPHQYLIQLRVERAKRLLEGAMPIVEVALSCGFTDQEHMTRLFRRSVGTTPGAFRRVAHG